MRAYEDIRTGELVLRDWLLKACGVAGESIMPELWVNVQFGLLGVRQIKVTREPGYQFRIVDFKAHNSWSAPGPPM